MKGVKYTFLVVLICWGHLVSGQEDGSITIPDSLESKSFEELRGVFRKSRSIAVRNVYAQAYLNKAKKNRDTIYIIYGYSFYAKIAKDSVALKYADSIIMITKEFKNRKFDSYGYDAKGNVYYNLGYYQNALNQYLIASEYAKKYGSRLNYLSIKFNIGLLKNNLGDREGALKIFKEYFRFVKGNNYPKDSPRYNIALYTLADSYTYNNQLDSASVLLKEGINNTMKNDLALYSYFVLNSGINYFFMENYQQAVDSLQKAKTLLVTENNKTNIAICYFYIGKSFVHLNQSEKSIFYFKNADSIMQETKDITPEIIESYDFLINYSKSKNDLEKQLYYINTLIAFDSILNTNYKYISNNITKKYETPTLIAEKEKLIYRLNSDKSMFMSFSIALLILSSIGILIAFYFYRRNIIYKKRFDALLIELESMPLLNAKSHALKESGLTGLSDRLVEDTLFKLNEFEKSQRFTKRTYTLNTLAKELKTNSTYLSKIINVTKNQNFSNYFNNLRIEYAIDQLTKNEKLRLYTIQAIAEEVGFKSAQSFSTAFHKKSGIYPSFFIKELNKQKINVND